MDIVTLLNLTGAAPQGTSPSIEQIDDMFASMLAQAQAPPGPEPPPDLALAGTGNEEQLKTEPNAQSETPDLLPRETIAPLVALQISQTQPLPEATVAPAAIAPEPALITMSHDVQAKPADVRVEADKIAELPVAKDLNLKSVEVQKPIAPENDTDLPVENTGAKPIPPQVDGKGHISQAFESELKQQIHVRNDKVTRGDDLFRKDGKIAPVAKSPIPVELTTGIPPLKSLANQTTQPFESEVVVSTVTAVATESANAESESFAGEHQPKQDESQGLPTLQFRERVDQTGRLEKSDFEIVQGLNRRETHAVVRQLADRLEFLAATNNREGVTIQLDPKELGSMTLVVKSEGSEIQAQVSTDNEAVRAAIAANRPQLQESLQNKGLTLTSLSFGTSLNDKQQGQQQQQNQAQQQLWNAGNHAQPLQFGVISNMNHAAMGSRSTGVDMWI